MKITKKANVSLPELAMLAASRAMTGMGLGMMIAQRIAPEKRKVIGWTLFAVGALSTIPLAFEILGKDSESTY
jgi:hypothetical protein